MGIEIIVRGSFTSVKLSLTAEDTEGNEKTPKIADGGDLKDIVSTFKSDLVNQLLYNLIKSLVSVFYTLENRYFFKSYLII